jgi:hypothetical protein
MPFHEKILSAIADLPPAFAPKDENAGFHPGEFLTDSREGVFFS